MNQNWTKWLKEDEWGGEIFCVCLHSPNNMSWSFTIVLPCFRCPYHFFEEKCYKIIWMNHEWTKRFKEDGWRGETFCVCLDSVNNLSWSLKIFFTNYRCPYHYFWKKRLQNHLNESKLDKMVQGRWMRRGNFLCVLG